MAPDSLSTVSSSLIPFACSRLIGLHLFPPTIWRHYKFSEIENHLIGQKLKLAKSTIQVQEKIISWQILIFIHSHTVLHSHMPSTTLGVVERHKDKFC